MERVALEDALELDTETRDFLEGENESDIDCFMEGLQEVKIFGDF